MTETVVFKNGVTVPQEVVEVACVLDRSGSMQSIKNDTIGGFNAFLEEQKKAGASVKMTLTVFSDRVAFMFDAVDIANVPALTPSTYIPNGMTALYDAIGKTIRHIETRFAAIPEAIRPTKVIMAIVTDGEENNSETFTSDIVRELIQAKTSIGWAFVFIGANQDAYAESAKIGIPKAMTMNFVPNARGVAQTYRSIGAAVLTYCATGKVSEQWNADSISKNGKLKSTTTD